MKLSLFLLICMAQVSFGKCKHFDIPDSLEYIPILVQGKVYQSNSASECENGKKECVHKFKIQVMDIMKGQVSADTLSVQYKYYYRLPGMANFKNDFEYIFALKKISNTGKAELYGTSCGKSGTTLDKKSEIEAAIQKLREPKGD